VKGKVKSKLLVLKIAILILSIVLIGYPGGNQRQAEAADVAMADRYSGDTVKVGFLANLTGSGAYTDIPPKLAIEDYIEELNAKGGLLGKKVELVAYDAGRDALTESVTAVNKMIQQDKVVALVGPTGSRYALPIIHLCNDSKTPCITIGATNAKITVNEDTGEVNPYMFRVSFIDPYQGSAMANFAYHDLGIKKLASLAAVDDLYAQGLLKYFTDEYKRLGGEFTDALSFQISDVEFRAQLSKAADGGAEVLWAPAAEYKFAAFIAKQAEQLGLEFTYLLPEGVYGSELLETAGPQLEGAYISVPMTEDDPVFADYKKAFDEKHKSTGYKANIYAYYGVDGIKLLEWAVNKAKSFDGEAIKNALESAVDVPLFTGSFTIEPDTHNPHNKAVSIVKVENSQYNLYKTFQPTD
jgi:branched-chain amino acid transport system substrate-binding protein